MDSDFVGFLFGSARGRGRGRGRGGRGAGPVRRGGFRGASRYQAFTKAPVS